MEAVMSIAHLLGWRSAPRSCKPHPVSLSSSAPRLSSTNSATQKQHNNQRHHSSSTTCVYVHVCVCGYNYWCTSKPIVVKYLYVCYSAPWWDHISVCSYSNRKGAARYGLNILYWGSEEAGVGCYIRISSWERERERDTLGQRWRLM